MCYSPFKGNKLQYLFNFPLQQIFVFILNYYFITNLC